MRGHQREADERILGGYCWSDNGINEDPFFIKLGSDAEGLFVVTDIERDDRCGGIADLEAEPAEAVEAVGRLLLKGLYTLGLTEHNLQRLVCGSCRSRRITSTEDVRASVVTEVIDRRLAPSDEATDRGKALTERPHDQIYILGESEVIADATAVVTEDTAAMGFIDHDLSSVLLRQADDLGEVT